MIDLTDWDRFHRGDRVRLAAGGGVGLVEGWKDDRVLVFWGTNNCLDYRTWCARYDLVLAEGGDDAGAAGEGGLQVGSARQGVPGPGGESAGGQAGPGDQGEPGTAPVA